MKDVYWQHRWLVRWVVILCITGTQSCETHVVDTLPTVQNENPDYESPEEVAYWDQVPTDTSNWENGLLPNGRRVKEYLLEKNPDFLKKLPTSGGRLGRTLDDVGPQEKKNTLIAQWLGIASYLTDPVAHAYPTPPGESPETSPKQQGLGYSFGQKNYLTRAAAPNGSCTTYRIHGLDCSGMLSTIVNAQGDGLLVTGNANNQRLVSTWETALKKRPDLNKLKPKDVTAKIKNPATDLESGDVVYWYGQDEQGRPTNTVNHIGMAFRVTSGAPVSVYQANGTDGTGTNKKKTSPEWCFTNFYNPTKPYSTTVLETIRKRGVRLMRPSETYWFNQRKWGVLRLVVDISGKWDVYFRCSGRDSDAPTSLQINLSETNSKGEVTGLGTGNDYDGKPFNVTFKGIYDEVSSRLAGDFSIIFPTTSGNRTDRIQVDLDTGGEGAQDDDTGYVPASKVISNGGCNLLVRLVNKEK